MRRLRDCKLRLAIIVAGLLCIGVWTPVFGEVTIHPPSHPVVAGEVSLFELRGFVPADVPRTAVKCEPANGFLARFAAPDGLQYLWFRPDKDGLCVLGVAISTGPDTPPDLMMVPVVVGGPGPQPEPDPEPQPQPDPTPPPPPIVVGEKIVIILEESGDRTEAMSELLSSPVLRGYATLKSHWIRIPDETDETTQDWVMPYQAILQQRGIKTPALIIVDRPAEGGSAGKLRWVGPLPATAEAVVELLKGNGG